MKNAAQSSKPKTQHEELDSSVQRHRQATAPRTLSGVLTQRGGEGGKEKKDQKVISVLVSKIVPVVQLVQGRIPPPNPRGFKEWVVASKLPPGTCSRISLTPELQPIGLWAKDQSTGTKDRSDIFTTG